MKAAMAPNANDTSGRANAARPMMNQVTVIGRTCTAIQLRQTTTGLVGSIRVAVAGRTGNTNFFTATFWNGSAQAAADFLTHPLGRLIAINGSLVSVPWVAKDGSTRESVSINVERFFFLDRPAKKAEVV